MSRVRPRAAAALTIAPAAVSGTVPAATAADTGGLRADIHAGVNRRKTRTPDGRWLSNARLQACNDVQGNVVRTPEYLAPLLTVPAAGVSDAATGSLQLVGAGKSKVRLFLKRGDAWTYVTDNTHVTAAEARAGLRLGLDGQDVHGRTGTARSRQHHLQRTPQQ